MKTKTKSKKVKRDWAYDDILCISKLRRWGVEMDEKYNRVLLEVRNTK